MTETKRKITASMIEGEEVKKKINVSYIGDVVFFALIAFMIAVLCWK